MEKFFVYYRRALALLALGSLLFSLIVCAVQLLDEFGGWGELCARLFTGTPSEQSGETPPRPAESDGTIFLCALF